MKKHLLLILISALFLSGCMKYLDPVYEPFPKFPTPEKIPFASPHGTVSLADSQIYWTNNNVTYSFSDTITETTADGIKITYVPIIITGLVNKTVQALINKKIADKINELKKYAKFENLPVYPGFYAAYPENKRKITGVTIENWIPYNSNNILSIRFDVSLEIQYSYRIAHRYDFTISDALNFDLNTGEEITLSDLFINGSDYQSALNTLVLLKSQSQTEPVPKDLVWYVDTYQYVGGFTGIRGDVKFVLYDNQIVLLLDENYPAFKNDFSTNSITLKISDLKDFMAISQRFTHNKTDLYTISMITKTRNYLYPVHTAITNETINTVKVFSQITFDDTLSNLYKTIRDQLLAADSATIASINDPKITSIYYTFNAIPNGTYMNVFSTMIDNDVYRFLYATYKPDGTKIAFSDVFADDFDYRTYFKNMIIKELKDYEDQYTEPLDPNVVFDELAPSLMLSNYDGTCYVSLTNSFIQDFSWEPGEFSFSIKITDDPSIFKIKPWTAQQY